MTRSQNDTETEIACACTRAISLKNTAGGEDYVVASFDVELPHADLTSLACVAALEGAESVSLVIGGFEIAKIGADEVEPGRDLLRALLGDGQWESIPLDLAVYHTASLRFVCRVPPGELDPEELRGALDAQRGAHEAADSLEYALGKLCEARFGAERIGEEVSEGLEEVVRRTEELSARIEAVADAASARVRVLTEEISGPGPEMPMRIRQRVHPIPRGEDATVTVPVTIGGRDNKLVFRFGMASVLFVH